MRWRQVVLHTTSTRGCCRRIVYRCYSHTAADDVGSAAHVARLLGAPVVLVVDANAMATSAAALVKGFHDFDPRVRVAGVILNRVGSEGHARWLQTAIERHVGIPVIGYLV